jgi:8-oxo-dGTP pyrophosphatase MutT (NUDIX family)
MHKLTVVTTDFGVDCDDQKAVSGLISGLEEGDDIAFIVNGPRPRLAAAAIAQKYRDATGRYPLIATGEQYREAEIPEDRIYSLLDGSSIVGGSASFIDGVLVPAERFMRTIDADIKSGRIKKFEQIVVAPLRSDAEYYTPLRPELAGDVEFLARWKSVEKAATTQFQRAGAQSCGGFNYMRSSAGVADGYIAMLEDQEFVQVYFDGAVAKDPEFLILMRQPRLPGVEEAVRAYIALKQVSWLSMTEEPGKLPGVEDMHAGMFTSDAQLPFGVHVSAANPAGFGAQRLLKEVCDVVPATEPAKYAAIMGQINAELENFDRQVLLILQRQHPEVTDLKTMRGLLHDAMVDALREFAGRRGIIGEGTPVGDFKALFDGAARQGKPLNAYEYMTEYKSVLFERSPLSREITEIAEKEMDKTRTDGRSYRDVMTSIIGSGGARAVVYDAVAVEASRAVRSNPLLQRHFSVGDRIINITMESVRRLRETNPDLYEDFKRDVVSGLVRDGGRTAMSHWMIDESDPARLEIVRRAKALGITGNPDRAAHALGAITLGDGRTVNAHVVHAIDPIITDGEEVVMIDRKNEPGKGKLALPGGFLDPTRGGGVETGIQAAAREAMEEVGVALDGGRLVGIRNMDRPYDVRVARSDLPQYGIHKGDVFMVSTQAVCFDVPDLARIDLVAGDDAAPGSARRVGIASLTRDAVGIPDHFDLIAAASSAEHARRGGQRS